MNNNENKNVFCRICNNKAELIFKSKVLRKYLVGYYVCPNCKLCQTERPYWLKEAYSSAIADADTGLLARNIALSKILAVYLFFLFGSGGKFLDYAGGYGVLTRLMRDLGFNFYWTDKFAANLLASKFEDRPNKKTKYKVITALEFFEHSDKPLQVIKNIYETYNPEALIFTTELYTEPPDKNWWYFAFNTGQHISFYHYQTLQFIARKLNKNFYSNNLNLHIISSKKIPYSKLWFINKFSPLLYYYLKSKMKTLTLIDHQNLI